VTIALLALALAVGVGVQRLYPRPWVLRVSWAAYFWTVTPALVFFSFTTVTFDRGLNLALIAAIAGSWLVIAAAVAYANAVSDDPAERGALVLAAGFANTGFVGYPLAQITYGDDGLALMVVYDRLGLLVPALAASTALARYYGRRSEAPSRWWVPALANPPLAAMIAAVALRAAGVDVPRVDAVGEIGGAIVGPAGFFLLGLALPLERVAHARPEVLRAAGALTIRFALSPLLLLACGLALEADVPATFVLGSAMPCAFHLLILAQVFELRPPLMRLLVVASTIPAIVIVAGIALV
jgi:predicted permease